MEDPFDGLIGYYLWPIIPFYRDQSFLVMIGTDPDMLLKLITEMIAIFYTL